MSERLGDGSHPAAAARLVALDDQRLADMRLDDDEIVDVEIVIILGVGDRRFQALAHVTRDALAREFEIGERGRHLLAADKLRQKIELLRTHAQHAGHRLGLGIRKRALAFLLAHKSSPAPYDVPPAGAAGAAAGAAAPGAAPGAAEELARLALRSDEWP